MFFSIIAAVSDSWFLPSYYLPLLISITYKAFYKKEKDILSFTLMIFTGILLFSHVIEKALGISVVSFSLGAYSAMV